MAVRGRRIVVGAAVVVLALASAGCGGTAVDEVGATATTVEPTTTTAPSTITTSTSVLTDEQAVLAAYQGYWDAWLVANDPPDPDHPDVERHATGAALRRVRDSIRNHRSVGQVIRLPEDPRYRHTATVMSLRDETAILSDCGVDDALLVDSASGRVLNSAVFTRRLRAELVRVEDRWKVQVVTTESTWDGVAGCAA